jgi:hypothetical protein
MNEIFQVEPSEFLAFNSPHIARRTVYVGKTFVDAMDPAGRFLVAQATDCNSAQQTPLLVSRRIPAHTTELTMLADDTGFVVDEYKSLMVNRDLQHNQCVFCLRCETKVEGEVVSGIGKSSAKVFVNPNGS